MKGGRYNCRENGGYLLPFLGLTLTEDFNMWSQQPIFPTYYPQQTAQTQMMPVQQMQKSAQFFSVESPQELDGIRPSLNVMYFGFNGKKKEIYVKQLTNDGLVSVETYSLAGDKKEKSELEIVLDKINELGNKISGGQNVQNNAANGANGNANVNVG